MKLSSAFITILCLTLGTIHLYGYELFFNNFTNKTLIIASKKRAGIVEKYYQIVKPGGSVLQPWGDANCLESLQWAELNPSLPLQGGLDLIDNNRGGQIPPDKQKKFDETFFSKKSGKGLYLWNNLKIVMLPDELYNKTKNAAAKLVKGIDQAVCSAVAKAAFELKNAGMAALKLTFDQTETRLQEVLEEQVKKIAVNAPETALIIIEQNITRLKKQVAELKPKLEGYLKQMEEYVSKATSKKDCFMHLSEIAKAAGKIHGISLCKSREFMILDTGEMDELTGMPLFIAETIEK